MNHDGLIAIVTGGGRGLGRAMALGLSAAGACVVVTAARERQEIEAVAAQQNTRLGRKALLPVLADVTSAGDCMRVVEAALAEFGDLDVLVNNAGRGMRYVSERFMTEPPRFWDVGPTTWQLVIETNVTGPFLMARAAVPHMLRRGWGRIVNVSMNRETMRRKGFSPYGPSKAALESETAIWAQDLDGSGVTVNALLPGGATRTGMVPANAPEAVQGALLQPEIVVAPLLWLTSRASDGVTGKRVVAARWNPDAPGQALEEAG